MGLETGTYISDLVVTNPLGSDAKSTADDHLRLMKSCIKATFPSVTGAVTLTHTQLNTVTTRGLITGQAWTGAHDFTAGAVTVAAPTVGAHAVTKTYADGLSFTTALPAQAGNSGKFITTDGSTASWGGITKTLVVLTSGTSWTCPAGITAVKVTAVGGGGGGSRYGTNPIGHGGSGAGCAIKLFTVVPATSYSYTIGAAGAGATVDNTAGSAGGNSTFVGSVTITGGGGLGGPASVSAGSATAGGTATNGDVNVSGSYSTSSSGGGNSFGGNSRFGTGSIGTTSEAIPKSGYGGGGNGAPNATNGFNGSQGVIILEY
jgi:hypothetical protein